MNNYNISEDRTVATDENGTQYNKVGENVYVGLGPIVRAVSYVDEDGVTITIQNIYEPSNEFECILNFVNPDVTISEDCEIATDNISGDVFTKNGDVLFRPLGPTIRVETFQNESSVLTVKEITEQSSEMIATLR